MPFIKPLRYDCEEDVFPDFVLKDVTSVDALPMEEFGMNTPEYLLRKQVKTRCRHHRQNVQLATLKQRGEKAARGPGRAPSGAVPHRLVPLSDPQYVAQLEMMVATLKIPLERRNPDTGRTEKVRLWTVTDRTVRTWLNEAVAAAAGDGVTFSVPVTPHTFRHSYAMHMLYAGIPLKALQSLMGHKSMKSTEVYTKVFALDVAARHRVQFHMPGTEAVAMLKSKT